MLHVLAALLVLTSVTLAQGNGNCQCIRTDTVSASVLCNGRSVLDRKTIQSCKNVTYYHFSGHGTLSNLTLLQDDLYGSLSDILFLNVSSSGLTKVEEDTFSDLPNLQTLDLSGNNIVSLPPRLFENSTNVNRLYLHNNAVIYFHQSLLRPLSNLTELTLSGNRLRYVDRRIYEESTSKYIDLRNNHLVCHCSNAWLLSVPYSSVLSDIAKVCPAEDMKAPCSYNVSVSTEKSTSLLLYSTLKVDCNITGEGLYSVVWISPRGEMFGRNSSLPWTPEVVLVNFTFSIPPNYQPTKVSVLEDNSLTVTFFRGYFSGVWMCVAYLSEVNISSSVSVGVDSALGLNYFTTLYVGFGSVAGILAIGILVGVIRYLEETKCCRIKIHRKDKKPIFEVIPVPDDNECEDDGSSGVSDSDMESGSSSDGRMTDVDLVFTDDAVAEEYEEVLTSLAGSDSDHHFRERLEDLRRRLRRDVGRRVEIIRTRMEDLHLKSTSRMNTLRTSSSAAAHRMRAGLSAKVRRVKGQMRSVAELCGSSHLGQTISLVSIQTNEEGGSHKKRIRDFVFE